MADSTYKQVKPQVGDIETGFYASSSGVDEDMRWAFVQKVYGIVAAQLVLTGIVASIVVFNPSIRDGLLGSPGLLIGAGIVPLILMCPLYAYRNSHPLNLVLLGFFTIFLSLAVGMSCAVTKGEIVLEAVLLTAAVVVGLTLYTFWASRQGYDFTFLGPFLFGGLLVLVIWGFIQVFFPLGPIGRMIFALIGALIFCGYIVYDTQLLLTKYSYDDYIWASVALYLDIINLFLYILDILNGRN
jgi:protein lifeguard